MVPGRIAWIVAALLWLAAMPVAGHGAPLPRDMEVRLIGDCEDDYHGDDGNVYGRAGHDLHALDLREAWNQARGDHLIFRLILNGEGDETIRVSFKVGTVSKTFDFVRSGNAWTGTFDEVQVIPASVIQDGSRFALDGILKRTTIGADLGDKLSAFSVVGRGPNSERDHMPGNDHPVARPCEPGDDAPYNEQTFLRPDYSITGPVRYVSATFDANDVKVTAGQEKFVTLDIANKLRDASQTASVSLSGPASIRLHDPKSNQYVTTATFDLNKRTQLGDSAFIHVAVTGDTPGKGTATVTVTTNLGGRVTDTLQYEILPAGSTAPPSPTTNEPPPKEESPGLPLAALVVLLAFLVRRR